jgi:putative oligomerization/nucleic acid binding protein
LLFLTVMTLCLVLVAIGYYYMRVVQPQLQAAKNIEPSEPAADAEAEPRAQGEARAQADALTTFVEQLQELARLRDQGILTSKEFTSKKTQLLERI